MFSLIKYAAMYAPFAGYRKDTKGASLAEYALLMGLVTAAIVATVAGLSGAISGVIDGAATTLSGGEGGGDDS